MSNDKRGHSHPLFDRMSKKKGCAGSGEKARKD